ncbi:hypothetical protein EN41_06305 [Agrobacterium tumefaciens]|nr:hypothetical protein EN41_06305 [Agrobacterium tumefaciens]
MATLGKIARYGELRMTVKPSRTIPPHVGAGGAMPRPTNASEASVRTAFAIQSEARTITSGRIAGRICLNNVLDPEKPIALHAWTYSRSRWVRTAARATRAKAGTDVKAMAAIMFVIVAPINATKAIPRISDGKARMTSMTCIRTISIFPPLNPAIMPTNVPIIMATSTARKPMRSE